MKTIAAVAMVVLLTGCAPAGLDKVLGNTTGGTATSQPQTAVHCDLIFPPASVNP